MKPRFGTDAAKLFIATVRKKNSPGRGDRNTHIIKYAWFAFHSFVPEVAKRFLLQFYAENACFEDYKRGDMLKEAHHSFASAECDYPSTSPKVAGP